MKHERCSYRGQAFTNEAAYEHHLNGPRQRCMTPAEMYDAGFVVQARGFFLDKPSPKKKSCRIKRPPELAL